MTLNALQALTWSTVVGAVGGALLLASMETNFSEWSRGRRADIPKPRATEAAAQRKPTERQPTLTQSEARREVSVR
ncbi:MAG: hypothetical protein JF606_07325 [Burkholderiales bacterium]|jgi:hypothetical protein|nr:hypothetical protein [Burkholderiales bacterium]